MLFALVFMFFNFYQLDIHNKTYVVLANLQWNICKKIDVHLFSHDYWKHVFVDFYTR